MELEHEFTVPVPVQQAWPVLLDVESVAPCMPGATLDSVDGDDFTGRLKVKVGPVTVTYRGSAGFTEKDEQSHSARIEASGKEARGSGTASATVRAQLHDEGDSTRVTVNTDLQVTGRPAQFGRNAMAEVGAKLIGQFADCLADRLAGAQAGIEAGAAAAPSAAPASATTGTTAAAPAGATTPSTSETQPAAASSPNGSSGERSADGQPATGGRAEPPPQRPASPGSQRPSAEAIDLFDVAGGPVLKRAAPAAGAVLAILAIVFLVRRKARR